MAGKEMKSIWYFVGLALLLMGGIILLTGLVLLFSPPAKQTVLFELHPNIWWGGIMTLVGVVFLSFNHKSRNDS